MRQLPVWLRLLCGISSPAEGHITVLPDPSYKTLRKLVTRSLSEKQYSKRYASLVECKDVNNSTTKSRLL